MNREAVETDKAPAAIGPYSQAVCAGDVVYCSGQIALTRDGQLVEGSIGEQTRQALTNLGAVLEAAGASLSSVVKTTVYLKDLKEFGAMNEVYGSFFGDSPPARATVEVSRLPKDVAVEIDCIALRG
ncbi:RidA family protein [Planctomycetota bacterium]